MQVHFGVVEREREVWSDAGTREVLVGHYERDQNVLDHFVDEAGGHQPLFTPHLGFVLVVPKLQRLVGDAHRDEQRGAGHAHIEKDVVDPVSLVGVARIVLGERVVPR